MERISHRLVRASICALSSPSARKPDRQLFRRPAVPPPPGMMSSRPPPPSLRRSACGEKAVRVSVSPGGAKALSARAFTRLHRTARRTGRQAPRARSLGHAQRHLLCFLLRRHEHVVKALLLLLLVFVLVCPRLLHVAVRHGGLRAGGLAGLLGRGRLRRRSALGTPALIRLCGAGGRRGRRVASAAMALRRRGVGRARGLRAAPLLSASLNLRLGGNGASLMGARVHQLDARPITA